MGEIIYSGIKALNQEEFSRMKELLTIFNDRIEKSFDSNLYVDIKTHDSNGKEDKRRKYVINLRLDIASSKRVVAESFDWDIAKATHKVIDGLSNELKHKIKRDESRINLRHMIHRKAKG